MRFVRQWEEGCEEPLDYSSQPGMWSAPAPGPVHMMTRPSYTCPSHPSDMRQFSQISPVARETAPSKTAQPAQLLTEFIPLIVSNAHITLYMQ